VKNYSYILAKLVIAGLVLALRFVFDGGARHRAEIPTLPGGVAYGEGFSTVSNWFQEAKSLLGKRDLVEAEKVYRKIIAAEPNNAPGYIGLGSCRFWQEDLEGAEEQYQKALTLNPRSSQALLGLAAVASRFGKHEKAVDFYERVLAVDGMLADAHWGLANNQYELKRNEQALRHYERFLELAPESSLAAKARDRIDQIRQQLARKP
jgi:tetratricopeptide (TPR) repeat protein